MSLLTIAKRAARRLQLPEIDQVIGNSQNNVRQILEIIQDSGNTLCQKKNSEGGFWSALERIHEFTTTASTSEYSLPSDFQAMMVNTAWAKDKYWLLRGSLNPRQWQQIRQRQSATSYNVFRILRTAAATVGAVGVNGAPNILRKFTLEPAPDDAQNLVYEYVSRSWWVSDDGQEFKREPTADTDESVFGDDMHIMDVVWQFKAANGLSFTTDLAKFETYRDTAFVQDEAAPPIAVGFGGNIYANSDESDVEWCP